MTRIGSRFSLPPPGLRRAAAGGVLVMALAGCVPATTAPYGADLGSYEGAARDLTGVTSFAADYVMRLGSGAAISPAERGRLEAFLAEIAYNRPESLRIVIYGRATAAQKSAITALLMADGVGPEHLGWGADAHPGRPVTRGTVVLAVERAIAVAPACPGFMGHPTAPGDNLAEPNLGCANVNNFAAMVADPHHLSRGASSIYYTGERGAKDVEAYRADKVKPLPRINQGFTVGGGSSGGGGGGGVGQ
jgi:pilus biogenesis lipoprotein CpaD